MLSSKVRAAYPTGFFDPPPTLPNSGYRLPAESKWDEDDCRAKPLHQSETAIVGGIREWQCAGKRGGIGTKNRGALFRHHGEEEGTAGNISAPKVGHKRNTEI